MKVIGKLVKKEKTHAKWTEIDDKKGLMNQKMKLNKFIISTKMNLL